ncbi:MAG: alpha/beta fold hydrolase [Xanthomonadales bacterium]|nr:alpha/beta fold hydrolase [Xanthomonadales bacterium]
MPDTNYPFRPAPGLRSGHVQSLLSSSAIRRQMVLKRAVDVKSVQRELTLDGGRDEEWDGEGARRVRLQAFWSSRQGAMPSDRPVAVLFHGWEGSADSNYVLGNAARLWAEGFDVLRFNFRDHGDTHHYNPGLFHSCRLQEVIRGLKDWQDQLDIPEWNLCGYSLGGNFSLRVALNSQEAGLRLRRVVAVCPVINPAHAMRAMDESGWFYQRYFERKWSRSLRKKKTLFPELYGDDDMDTIRGLNARTEYIARRYSGYESAAHYYDGYSVGKGRLASMQVPTTILTAADDPVVPVWDFADAEGIPSIELLVSAYGGHCGFLRNWRFESAAEDLILERFLAESAPVQQQAPANPRMGRAPAPSSGAEGSA